MTNKVPSIEPEHALGILGLFLMLVIARLAPRAYEPQRTSADRLTSFLARRVIDGIAVIGWLADHLPAPSAPHIGEPTLQRAR
jgi:hypothetical protein